MHLNLPVQSRMSLDQQVFEPVLSVGASSRAWGSGASDNNIERPGSFSLNAQGNVLPCRVFSNDALEVRKVMD